MDFWYLRDNLDIYINKTNRLNIYPSPDHFCSPNFLEISSGTLAEILLEIFLNFFIFIYEKNWGGEIL